MRLVFASALGVALGLVAPGETHVHGLQRTAENREDLRHLTLPERARRLRGVVVVTLSMGPLGVAPDLRWLGAASEVVLLAEPTNRQSILSDSKRSITTYCRLHVREVFKGGISSYEPLILYWPGGRVAFEKGLGAEVRVIGLELPEIGKEYVFFLTQIQRGDPLLDPQDRGPVYRLTLGSQSVFDLDSSDNVRSAAAVNHQSPCTTVNLATTSSVDLDG